ncbi:MAG: hypothetical protein GKR94_06790 [Gammaproteobacteria bacterium]|nr:hypothetical protein [Gammaproteobacteria bacterium]
MTTRAIWRGVFYALLLTAGNLAAPVAAAVSIVDVTLKLIAHDLTAPVHLEAVPGNPRSRVIVEQTGIVHRLDENNTLHRAAVLDLRPRLVELLRGFDERGLLGFAFHPDFAQNGQFYVTYTAPLRPGAPSGWNYTRRVSEFTVDDPSNPTTELGTERVLLELDWPSRKHNGGGLAFGPDGYLYIGFGDGGGVHGVGKEVLNDAFNVPPVRRHWDAQAQDTTTWFGSILRIDVNRGFPGYAIPRTNPFKGVHGRPEIYAWGFRNPYRISFDRAGTGDFFVTAIAETLWEAVYRVRGPGNFGWPIWEGFHCFSRITPLSPPKNCPRIGAQGEVIQFPIIEYPNMSVLRKGAPAGLFGKGTAVVGGVLYRGGAIADLKSNFILGDWSQDFRKPSGQLWRASPTSRWGEPWKLEPLLTLNTRIISVSQDADGEIYVLTSDEFGPFGVSGKVFKLLPGQ